MNDLLMEAQNHLLAPTSIETQDLSKVINYLLSSRVDLADLYFQSSHRESWILEEGLVKNGTFQVDSGVGVRAVIGEKVGFSYSNEIVLSAIEQAATVAKSIAKQGQNKQIPIWNQSKIPALYSNKNPLNSISNEEKIVLMQTLDQEAKKQDNRVKKVTVALSGVYDVVMVVASDGTLGADIRPLVRLDITVLVEHNGRVESGHSGGGGRLDYHHIVENGKEYAKDAVRQALVNLDALQAPAGAMPVVLSSGWCGVLLHEAVGHGLEGDGNRKGSSSYSGRIGEKVASSLCTIVDNGTLSDRRGSLSMDDEGEKTQNTVLIEDGVLKGYMYDKLNAKLMGVASTGNGRRQSYAHQPIPRMTNTYMLAGKSDPREIIQSVDRGIYIASMAGGQVDITSGKFVFSANEAYLIEKGKVGAPVKGVTLIGNGPDVMNKVSMVGNDLQLDNGIGVCGKSGQSVPVGVGQPTLKIDEITVGGTS